MLATANTYHKVRHGLYERGLKSPVGVSQDDPQFGFCCLENSSEKHKIQHYDVNYTIGPQGERVTAASEKPVGREVIVGGAFTFGAGVDHDETYTHILSRQWREGDNPPAMIL